jgi:hypothetical protein
MEDAKDGMIIFGGGIRFKPSSAFRLEIQDPANDQLVHSTLSLVLGHACIASSGTIDLKCDSHVLEMYNDIVSLLPRLRPRRSHG